MSSPESFLPNAHPNPPSGGPSNASLIQEVATRAEKKVGQIGATAGLKKHAYAKKLLDRYQRRYGRRGLETEVNYKGHRPAGYGEKGSTRLDVYDITTGEVYDYKFTQKPGRGVPQSQQHKIRREGPRNMRNIIEVNPRHESKTDRRF